MTHREDPISCYHSGSEWVWQWRDTLYSIHFLNFFSFDWATIKVKLVTVVERDPKAPFAIATTPSCRGGGHSFSRLAPLYAWYIGEGATPFPRFLHFTLGTYLIMLSVKQGGIKYHFLSLWYDRTWDWTVAFAILPRPVMWLKLTSWHHCKWISVLFTTWRLSALTQFQNQTCLPLCSTNCVEL